MVSYTINGKEHSEFDINKRCAEIMGFVVCNNAKMAERQHPSYRAHTLNNVWVNTELNKSHHGFKYNPHNNPLDAWPIIEKVWDSLMLLVNDDGNLPEFEGDDCFTKWEYLVYKHNCSKLIAACICLIEVYGGEL